MTRVLHITLIGVIAAALAIVGGCVPRQGEPQTQEERENAMMQERLSVVTTFFPLYDFARTIGGDRVQAVNLVPAGVEPHDWSPKSRDMIQISNARLFVYQGAGFEGWTEDVLRGLDAGNLVIVEASRGIELLSASGESGHRHDDDEDGDHGHDHGDIDPHTWLSPRSALRMADNIAEGLKRADPEHASTYDANYERLKAELETLDAAYAERLSRAANKEMVVSHQAFGYLARDYGLVQMPMLGLSPEGEPTARDLQRISEFVKEHGVKTIFTEQLVSAALAETLAKDLGVGTMPLHPLEGLTQEEAAAGESYISLMERNLDRLAEALQ